MKEWFCNWFNSPYYHVLYGHRNQQEADDVIHALVTQLKIKSGSSVTDLGCGTGRHCLALHNHGLKVTGIDLSENSIQTARQQSPTEIQYHVADMRKTLPVTAQRAIFSLFTSFGYFDNEKENLQVLTNIHQALTPNGWLVLDYLNAYPLRNMTPQQHVITQEGIEFQITKRADDKIISKEITFTANGKKHTYAENVSLFTLQQFSDMLTQTGFQIIDTFGSYTLQTYDPSTSPRLILTAQKK